MAEKELAVLLTAKNLASGPINRVKGDISSLDSVASRAGKGIRTIGSNLKTIGIGAGVIAVGVGFAAIKSGLDSLAEREGVISATTAAIKAQGAAATVSAGEVRNWSEELERATGAAVDDKAIQASANTLIRFGVISHDTFQRALADATDLGAGLRTGPEAGAKLLGKALADPAKAMGALKKAGIVLTEAETKRIKQLVKGNKVQEAQVVLLEAVEARYKGAAAASAGPYQRALNLLADASEDAKMALAEGFLPVLEKVADKLSGALSDPRTMDAIRSGGKAVAGFLDDALDAASQIPWGSIADAMVLAGQGAKAALDLFTGMPPWVQTAVLTGWGLNKLSGGALGGIVGELGKGLIKGVLGINAGVVNINAGVVNGGGIPGVGGAAGGAAAAAGGVGLGAGLAGIAAGVAVSALAIMGLGELSNALSTPQQKAEMQQRVIDQNLIKRRPQGAPTSSGGFGGRSIIEGMAFGAPSRAQTQAALAGVRASERTERALSGPVVRELQATSRITGSTAPSIKSAEAHLASIKALQQTEAGRSSADSAALRTAIGALTTAIANFKVNVSVSAADNAAKDVRRRRTVKPAGSRNALVSEFG